MKTNELYPLLLIEDDENDVLFFERAVRKASAPFAVHVLRDGAAAIEYFRGEREFADRNKHPLPCLTFLDLNLPLKHGLEVLKSLRENSEIERTPVIVLTSSLADQDIREAYNLGANSYVAKPASADRLVDILLEVQAHWFGVAVLPGSCEHQP